MSQEKKNEEVKMTGFFQSLKSVLLTAKVIFRMDWKNIPAHGRNKKLMQEVRLLEIVRSLVNSRTFYPTTLQFF